ncbi:MAG: FAD:protein FMN transferase [Treponema sp.]|nr:FAD:protein FMN transferase [Treponema sp.]
MICKKIKNPFIVLCILFFLNFLSCPRTEASRAEFALGTVCSITLFEQGQSDIYREIFNRLREIENRMSVNIPSSDISRVNAAAGIEPVKVHEDVFRVLERSVHFARLSDGAFDPSVGPVVSLWGIGKDNQRVPAQPEIDEVLPLVNWRDIELDARSGSVFLGKVGMALDLGSIAKGYAADEAAAIIKRAGIKRAIVDLGGNIVVCGEKKDKSPWKVGLQNPGGKRGEYAGIIMANEKTVVTSGVYERYFEQDGFRYHHIFSPSRGYPADTGILSATIITANSMDADALSTAVFVLGCEKGLSLIKSIPETEAVLIMEDKSIIATSAADFILTDKTFYYKK